LHKTLPSDESFHRFRSSSEPSSGSETIDKIAIGVVGALVIDNYFFFKLASLGMAKDRKNYYLGVANNWVPMQ